MSKTEVERKGGIYGPLLPTSVLDMISSKNSVRWHSSAACHAITADVAAAPAQSEYYNIRQIRTTNDTLRYAAPSIVSYLLERNARYLMLGSIHYITFVHYLEHELRSSQRMFKQFTGKVMTRARGS